MVYNKKALISIAGVIVLIFTIYIAVSASKKPIEVNAKTQKVYPVQVINIESSSQGIALNYSGLIQPEQLEQATFATVGKIKKIYVKEGDNIKKGQALVTIDDETALQQQKSALQSMQSAEAAMNSAKVSADAAQSNYDNSIKGASQAQIEAARLNLESAKKERDTLKVDVERINSICQPKKDALSNAQIELDNAKKTLDDGNIDVANKKEKMDFAKVELDNDPTNTEKQNAFTEAEGAYNTALEDIAIKQADIVAKETALRTAQLELINEETTLQKTQKEAQLQSAEGLVITRQAEYDRLINQGTVDSQALLAQKNSTYYAYESASSTYDAAKSNYEAATKRVDECTYKALSDGFIVKVVGAVGSLATPLAPVLVVGSTNVVAQFGISQTDVREITQGLNAKVLVSGIEYEGTVKDVSVLPDESTRTYLTNVIVKNAPRDLYIGEIANVSIDLGNKDGIWIPLSVVLNDGKDYVYIIEDEKALRKEISITNISNDLVQVTGLEGGGKVISQGMKTVKSGSLVTVIE